MRLWLLLTLIVDGLILLAYAGYGSYIAENATDRLQHGRQGDAQNLALSIAAVTADDLLLGNYDRIENRLFRMVTLGSARDLVVFDSGSHPVVRVTRKSADGSPVVDYSGPTQSLDLSQREILVPDQRYTLLEPIGRPPNQVGWIRVSVDLEELAALRQSIWYSTLLAALTTALVVSVLLAFFLRKVTASLGSAAQFAGDLVNQRGDALPMDSHIVEID